MFDLISIIIPVYNVQEYLSKCINSILRQTYANLEIILINDGSTDNSGRICDEFSEIDDRIKVIHTENKGVSSARNLGIDISRGRYIGFIDSDDWIEVRMYELLYTSLIQNDADIAICDAFIEGSTTKIHRVLNKSCVLNRNEMFNEIPHNEGFNWLCNKLFKRELFKNVRLNENIYIGEDILCICECICYGNKFSYISEPMYHYLKRSNSVCNSEFNLKKITNIDAYKKILKLYEKNASMYIDKAIEMYIIANIDVIKWVTISKFNDKYIINKSKGNIEFILNSRKNKLSIKCKIKIILIKISPSILCGVTDLYKKILISLFKLEK